MVFICGDTHGTHDTQKLYDFWRKNEVQGLELTKDDYVIVCGDFGLLFDNPYLLTIRYEKGQTLPICPLDNNWGEKELNLFNWYNKAPWTTLWVDGNHENFDRIAMYPTSKWHGGIVQKISDSVIHLMRGEIYNIDGHTYFCMGGAMSTDRGPARGDEYLSKGNWWWPEEIPNGMEWTHACHNLEKHQDQVDFIITHDAPAAVYEQIRFYPSSVSKHLDLFRQSIHFTHWFCGHLHTDKDFGKISILYNRLPVNVNNFLKGESNESL